MAYRFNGQLSGEDVVLVSKQHPFVLLRSTLVSVGILLLPSVAYLFLPFGPALSYLIPICLGLAGYLAYRSWHEWNSSLFLLTNKRILVLFQKGLLRREVAGSGLEHIHRVTHSVHGLLPTLFSYGTISIMTDDPQTAMTMPAISRPFDVQQKILQTISGGEIQGDEEEDEAA